MKLKMILAVAAVGLAAVASATTNYAEIAARDLNLYGVCWRLRADPELRDPAALAATTRAIDERMKDLPEKLDWRGVSRCFPQTARAVLARTSDMGESAKEAMLANCRDGGEMIPIMLRSGETRYVDLVLQLAVRQKYVGGSWKAAVLNHCVKAARKRVRANGETFVGKEGAKRVKVLLDELASELDAPRLGRTKEILANLGVPVDWEAVSAPLMTAEEAARVSRQVLDGERDFDRSLQARLCLALGVEAYNALVREYNGTAADEAKEGTPKGAPDPVAVSVVAGTALTEPAEVRAVPAAAVASACEGVAASIDGTFLSAPWSVTRRLKAARQKGDEAEAKRMEGLLDVAVLQSLEGGNE